jgi:4-hydroxyphenylpyruvate dioxygenase
MTTANYEAASAQESYSLGLKGIDYIEFYMGNAREAMHFYRSAFGLTPVAYAGLETGVRDRVSLVMEQAKIRLVLTTALDPNSPIAEHVKQHGDGVKDIAFTVNDAARAFEEAVKRGARPVMEPTRLEDSTGHVIKATIGAYGDTVHSFIQRKAYDGNFLPDFRKLEQGPPALNTFLSTIDHVAISVEPGQLDQWVDFYKGVLGFHQSHQEDVSTEYSAMNSKVVQNKSGQIKFPIMEPAAGRRKSQIEEYLTFYRGPGVQHIALLSKDILRSVQAIRSTGVEFLQTPHTYYEILSERIKDLDENIAALRNLNILVDREVDGYLMQIFTKSLHVRPTLFMEIIQRKGAHGFGSGNIRALFEAVEREQAIREAL